MPYETKPLSSMLLHEVYFNSPGATEATTNRADQLNADFGGLDKWATQFAAMG